MIDDVEQHGVKVVGVVSDGAANCQKALKEVRSAVLGTWCYAHLTSLLCKDLIKLFETQLEQAKELCNFFRLRHLPHVRYNEAAAFFEGSTQPARFVETRWGSAIIQAFACNMSSN